MKKKQQIINTINYMFHKIHVLFCGIRMKQNTMDKVHILIDHTYKTS